MENSKLSVLFLLQRNRLNQQKNVLLDVGLLF